MNHRHGNSVASFKCTLFNKSIIYITMHKQKLPNYKLSCKTPKHSKLRLTDFLEIPVNFFYCWGVDFSSRNNLSNLGPCRMYNSLVAGVVLGTFALICVLLARCSRMKSTRTDCKIGLCKQFPLSDKSELSASVETC